MLFEITEFLSVEELTSFSVITFRESVCLSAGLVEIFAAGLTLV
jgi:hypothetical protein